MPFFKESRIKLSGSFVNISTSFLLSAIFVNVKSPNKRFTKINILFSTLFI